jgi:hypothetical protein
MGLWRGKVQSISTGFYILLRVDDKGASIYQEEKIRTKKRERKKWESIYQEAQRTCFGLGGLHHKKRREELLSANHIEKYRKRQYMEQACLYF